ncbi:hypothetical protein G5714_007501 [Onychostoma macrolepis]|uniref:Uncharacterized protein n=1 Tax=Onychostoma macrolepis TaxID=369639 RepID=A0A7J6CT81_9TELE|nr:hypothetical protein G5714_007501 [Onychostoma macrolepis]
MCPTVIGSWWRNIKRCSEPSDKMPRQLPDTSNRTGRETFCIHDHLREDFSLDYGLTLIITPNPKDSDDDYSFHHLDTGIILTEHEGDVLSSSLRLNPASLKIIIEGDFVMDSIEDLSKAVHSVWTYALHLNYPKPMKNTFQIIQQVLLMLGHSELKPRLQKEMQEASMRSHLCSAVRDIKVCSVSAYQCC